MFGLLESAIAALSSDVHRVLVFIMQRVNTLTTAVENCYVMKETIYDLGRNHMHLELPEGLSKEQVDQAKELLVLFRQYELYIR